MGKTAGRSVIRPSKRIVYDTKEAVVSFLSENVNTCVDEFLEEWARVSKMVVIAREGRRQRSYLANRYRNGLFSGTDDKSQGLARYTPAIL